MGKLTGVLTGNIWDLTAHCDVWGHSSLLFPVTVPKRGSRSLPAPSASFPPSIPPIFHRKGKNITDSQCPQTNISQEVEGNVRGERTPVHSQRSLEQGGTFPSLSQPLIQKVTVLPCFSEADCGCQPIESQIPSSPVVGGQPGPGNSKNPGGDNC